MRSSNYLLYHFQTRHEVNRKRTHPFSFFLSLVLILHDDDEEKREKCMHNFSALSLVYLAHNSSCNLFTNSTKTCSPDSVEIQSINTLNTNKKHIIKSA